MGTRHLQVVIDKEGTEKVRQYGQWDGYPDGQGKDILEFFRINKMRLKEYQVNLEKIGLATEADVEKIDQEPHWQEKYPWMSRDCGSKIHGLILAGEVPFVSHIDENEARSWCEGFYTIDFQKNKFIAEFYGTVKEYPLDNLPTKRKFLKDFEE